MADALAYVGRVRATSTRLAFRAFPCEAQIGFLSHCLDRYELAGVVTTNYDLTPEQVLGVEPCAARPGFNYGALNCSFHPASSPFPRERHSYQGPGGLVPVSKLHGSLNWSLESESLVVYCEAFAVLSNADVWIVAGYSLPAYDTEVRRLFSAARHDQRMAIYDPSAERVASAFAEAISGAGRTRTFDRRIMSRAGTRL